MLEAQKELIMFEEYPQEFFLALNSADSRVDNDFLEVRITVNLLDDRFSAEIDLVQKESRKIWKHLGLLGPFSPKIAKDEVLEICVQTVANLLKAKKQ